MHIVNLVVICLCVYVSMFFCLLVLISGFHRALLESLTFIGRLNALDYTKLRG